MHSLFTRGIAAALLLCACALARAQGEPIELFTRVVRYDTVYTINPDGSHDETREWEVKALKQQAVEGLKRASISYSTSIQSAKVLAAYTRKADGRRIDVPESNYQMEAAGGKDKGAPAYSDRSSMSVIFPDVAVGDSVVFAYRLTAKEPMFPGHFSVNEAINAYVAYDALRLKIDAPAALWTQFQANGMTEVQRTEKDGRKIYEWTYSNPTPLKPKRTDFSIYDLDKEPGVMFSTFRNYNEIAEAYGTRARPKAAVTPRVQKLADEIAGDKKAPREVARLLYDWVSTNINYAGNCVGLGAVVPRDLDFTLDNRLGDCKDHATLLQALLSARGIKSAQALVNSGSTYRLAKVPVVSMVNHVINYLPEFDLYVDSTSDDTPFGMLPWGDADKPVLLVDGYRDGARTPAAPPGSNEQVMKTHAKVGPDGTINGEVEITLRGAFAVSARSRFRNIGQEAEQNFVKNMFRSGGYIATGTLNRDDAKALLDTYKYGAKFEVKGMLPLPGAGAFSVSPLIYSIAPVSGFAGSGNQEGDAENEGTCSNGRSVEEYVIEFPKATQVLALPPNMKIGNGFLDYTATHTLKGNVLTVRRVYDDRTKGNVCSPAIGIATRDFARKVMANLKAQVVYK